MLKSSSVIVNIDAAASRLFMSRESLLHALRSYSALPIVVLSVPKWSIIWTTWQEEEAEVGLEEDRFVGATGAAPFHGVAFLSRKNVFEITRNGCTDVRIMRRRGAEPTTGWLTDGPQTIRLQDVGILESDLLVFDKVIEAFLRPMHEASLRAGEANGLAKSREAFNKLAGWHETVLTALSALATDGKGAKRAPGQVFGERAPPADKGLSLTHERSLVRTIGALLLKIREERQTRSVARKLDLKTIIADVAKDADALARQFRRDRKRDETLPNKFGLGDDTVRKLLSAGVDAILDDSWFSDPK